MAEENTGNRVTQDDPLTERHGSQARALLRAPEVQEIIGRVPHWLIRTGISLLGGVLSIFLILSWYVKYPEILQGDVVITTDPAPIVLVARTSGAVQLLKNNQQFCTKDEIIAIIESPENIAEVLMLEGLLTTDTTGDEWNFSDLGSLQPAYNQYEAAKRKYNQFIASRPYDHQIAILEKQIEAQFRLKESLARQWRITRKQVLISRKKFATDSLLFRQKVTSKTDYQRQENEYLQDQKQFETAKTALLNQEVRLEELKGVMVKLELDKERESRSIHEDHSGSRKELIMKIKQWKDVHLLVAPEDGQLFYLDMLIRNKYVQSGEPLFSVVPQERSIVVVARIPARGSGKVKEGQRVNIKLDNYPFEQFGMLVGTVKSISLTPTDGHYNLQIELQDHQLVTTHGKRLEVRVNLAGHTEVITEDMRLIERIFQWIRLLKSRTQNR